MSTPNKTVFISGRFNIVHPGHLRLIRFARELGSRLVVGVESDRLAGKDAYLKENFRLESIRSISWVDESFLMDDVEETLLRLKPDIVVKGKDHEARFNLEQAALDQYGGKLIFGSGETVFSSIDLLRNGYFALEPTSIHFPTAYNGRHGIQGSRLSELLRGFSKLRVCVIGDLIIDEYITCEPLGMSQEDPTIVVTPIDSAKFVGGAGIVASHAAGLGAEVFFFSVAGDDELRQYALDHLKGNGVSPCLISDMSRPTTLKQRFRSKGKTLLRVSHLRQGAIPKDVQEKLLDEVKKKIDQVDLLVFSDFNYGCLPQDLVDQILILAKNKNIVLAADSQSSSQVGNVARFKGMDLLTPTEREARLSTRDEEDGLIVLVEKLRQLSLAKNILLKLGEEGLLIHMGNTQDPGAFLTDRLEALNSSPKDVSGAGDSLLIAAAMTLASKGTIWEAASLGSLAAAIQVGRIGNVPLRAEELLKELK